MPRSLRGGRRFVVTYGIMLHDRGVGHARNQNQATSLLEDARDIFRHVAI
jgi:hypothetical protein